MTRLPPLLPPPALCHVLACIIGHRLSPPSLVRRRQGISAGHTLLHEDLAAYRRALIVIGNTGIQAAKHIFTCVCCKPTPANVSSLGAARAPPRTYRPRAFHHKTHQPPSFRSPILPGLASSRPPVFLNLGLRYVRAARIPSKLQETRA